jgi:uncharacterized protein YpmB
VKKWFFIVGIVVLIFIWQLLLIYRDFKSAEVAKAEDALAVAKSETNVASVLSVDYYPGDRGHHVITGKNRDGEKVVIWVQDDDVWSERLSDGVSRDDILSQLPEADIKRILPGLITEKNGEKRPIWDVYYTTEDGEAQYVYFDFFTGEQIQSISL